MRAWVFWVVVVAAICFGIAGITSAALWDFYGKGLIRDLVRALAEALLIAGFLSATVDRYVKWYLLREASLDISKFLIGYNLPVEIQDCIKDLMATAIVRRNFEQKYDLQRNEGGTMRLTTEFQYTVMNCAHTARDFTPRLDFEKHEAATVVEFRCDSSDKKAVDHKTKGKTELIEEQSGTVSIALKKISVQPGVSYHVSGKHFRTVKTNDSDVVSFIAPTIGLVVKAEHPDGFSFAVGRATVETQDRWEFRRAFLPLQQIHVRWFEG